MTSIRSLTLWALVLLCGAPLVAQDDTPWLGLRLRVLEAEERKTLKVESGLYVTEVAKGSPAETAGLEKGDIVLSAGEKSVNSIEEMAEQISKRRPGDSLGLGVRHKDGKVEPMMVTLGRKGSQSDEYKDDQRAKELRAEIEKRRKELRDLEDELKKRIEDLRSGRAKTETRPTPKTDPKVEEPTEKPEPKVEAKDPTRTEVKVKMGASFADVDSAEAKKLGLDGGLLTSKVAAGSAAEKAGLKEGDLVYEVGGEKVTGTGHLRTLLAKYNAGDKVELKIIRKGKKESVSVTLDAR